MRLVPALVVSLLIFPVLQAMAGDEEAQIEFFYPVAIGRPVIERELELKVEYADGRGSRETTVTGAIDLPLLPRWQIELEVPGVLADPPAGPAAGGVGDIELENKFLLFQSVEFPALVAAGFSAKFPTGSDARGLGGEAGIEPFVRAGVALGRFDLLGEVAWDLNLTAQVHGQREQELTAGLAVGYIATRRLVPLLELTTVSKLRGEDKDSERLRGRTQVYLTPGANMKVAPGTTARVGVALPVSEVKRFDYALRGGIAWEF